MRVNRKKVRDLIEERILEGIDNGLEYDTTADHIMNDLEEMIRFIEIYDKECSGLAIQIKMLIERQMLFSARQFGNRFARTGKAPAKHLIEEANELFDNPEDIVEGADVFLLLIDWMWRQGFEFEELLEAASEKLKKNASAEWSEPDEHGKCKRIK